MTARDTTPEAAALQLAIYQRMRPGKRCEIAVEMSLAARDLTLAGIRMRHQSYDVQEARFALFRLLLGDDLFRRAWPSAPLLDP